MPAPPETPTTAETVDVEYTCHSCEAKERKLKVPARDPKVDVVRWMRETVAYVVNKDHAEFHCYAQVFDLKVALPKDGEYIGQATSRS